MFNRKRRGYTRHNECNSQEEQEHDSKTLLPHFHHARRSLWSFRLSRPCFAMEPIVPEDSRNDDLVQHKKKSIGRLDLVRCWRKPEREMEPLQPLDDEPSMDSSLSSVQDPWWKTHPVYDYPSVRPDLTLSLLGERSSEDGDMCESLYEMSPPRFPIQHRKRIPPDDFPSDVPLSSHENMMEYLTASPTMDDEDGVIPPSPLETENGVEEQVSIDEQDDFREDEDDESENLDTRDFYGTESEGSFDTTFIDLNEEDEEGNPFFISKVPLTRFCPLKGSDASSAFSLESMDSLVASHWDPDDGLSSVATLVMTNTVVSKQNVVPDAKFYMSEHLGYLKAKVGDHCIEPADVLS